MKISRFKADLREQCKSFDWFKRTCEYHGIDWKALIRHHKNTPDVLFCRAIMIDIRTGRLK